MPVDELCVLGKALRYSHAFPKGANVSFVKLMGKDEVKAVTYERGVEDFTLACGTGQNNHRHGLRQHRDSSDSHGAGVGRKRQGLHARR